MKFIGKDNLLFDILKKDGRLISSSIVRIDVFIENFELIIEVDLKLIYSEENSIRLRFSKVKEYSFYYNSNYRFYTVESYKLIMHGNLFFISFDPEDETSCSISENDQDSIMYGSFEAFIIE